MLGLRPRGLISPAAPADDLWLPINLFKWLSSQEHLLCCRASCGICSDIWSYFSGDRLGSRGTDSWTFVAWGKARLPISSSEGKQTFSLVSAIAPKCNRVPGLRLPLSPPVPALLFGSDGGRGDHKSRPVVLKPGGLMKIQIAVFNPRISDSVGLAWEPIAYISNNFPADADAIGLGAPLVFNPGKVRGYQDGGGGLVRFRLG